MASVTSVVVKDHKLLIGVTADDRQPHYRIDFVELHVTPKAANYEPTTLIQKATRRSSFNTHQQHEANLEISLKDFQFSEANDYWLVAYQNLRGVEEVWEHSNITSDLRKYSQADSTDR